jgi:hypothetical protein
MSRTPTLWQLRSGFLCSCGSALRGFVGGLQVREVSGLECIQDVFDGQVGESCVPGSFNGEVLSREVTFKSAKIICNGQRIGES